MDQVKLRKEQLGMHPSTASGRLVKDILFKLAVEAGYKCFQCGEDLTRETYSIEHKVPWLHSEDPTGLFFDQENIAFSHLKCNTSAARTPNKKYHTKEARREADAKMQRDAWANLSKEEQQLKRRAKYLKHGK